jgi:hypothetical protein
MGPGRACRRTFISIRCVSAPGAASGQLIPWHYSCKCHATRFASLLWRRAPSSGRPYILGGNGAPIRIHAGSVGGHTRSEAFGQDLADKPPVTCRKAHYRVHRLHIGGILTHHASPAAPAPARAHLYVQIELGPDLHSAEDPRTRVWGVARTGRASTTTGTGSPSKREPRWMNLCVGLGSRMYARTATCRAVHPWPTHRTAA